MRVDRKMYQQGLKMYVKYMNKYTYTHYIHSCPF